MNTSDSLAALRRANARANLTGQRADVLRATVDARISADRPPRVRIPRRRAVALSVASVVVATVVLLVVSLDRTPRVETASAAIAHAAAVTAASAQQSGIVVVRITHDGRPWAGKTVRWSGSDIAIVDDAGQGRPQGRGLRVVDGIFYGTDPRDGGWVTLGPESSIDPGSGTTPAEQLAAVRADVGGPTLRRLITGMTGTGLATRELLDGSTLYSGSAPAGLIARETGFKEGQAIRVLPFGYVAHDEAADPASLLRVGVTVGADAVVREIAVSWGQRSSSWVYTVRYSDLGTAPAVVAPPDAKPFDRTP